MSAAFWRGFWQGLNPLFGVMWALWAVDRLMWRALCRWGHWRWWSLTAYRIQVWAMYRWVNLKSRYGFDEPGGRQ